MKQTLTLSGDKKAIIQIPYSKLMTSQANQWKTQDHKCCDSKIIVTGGNTTKSKNNLQLTKMILEVEEAYENDVKLLQANIDQLSLKIVLQQKEKSLAIDSLKRDYDLRLTVLQKQLVLKSNEVKNKDTEILKLTSEKQIIIRNKICEFQQNQYISKLNQQGKYLSLKDTQIKELLSKVQLVQLQRLKVEQLYENDRIKWQSEFARIALQMNEATSKLTKEQDNLTYLSSQREQDLERKIRDYTYKIERSSNDLKDIEQENRLKSQQITNLNQSIKLLETKNLNFQNELQTLRHDYSNLTKQRNELIKKIQVDNRVIVQFQSQKDMLMNELTLKYGEIQLLRHDLANKEKVCEVRIERVIDGKQQIEQLQTAIFQLEQQLKQLSQDKDYLSEDLKKRQNYIIELSSKISSLQAQVSSLKAYINKREGSFKWAVEREIEKDIIVSDSVAQIYKVSKVKQYYREGNSSQGERLIAEQIAFNMEANLKRNFPSQITIENIR